VRVGNDQTEVNVTMNQTGALFGKIRGTSGETWKAANAQTSGN
jgi:hypothetical protein